VKGLREAKQIYQGLKRFEKNPKNAISEDELRSIWGVLLENDEVKDKLQKTLLIGGIPWPMASESTTGTVQDVTGEEADGNAAEGADGGYLSDISEVSVQEEKEKTVRKLKRRYNISDHVDINNHVVIKEYKLAGKKELLDLASLNNNAKIISQFLCFSERDEPLRTDYLALVNTEKARKYMHLARKSMCLDSTLFTYAKAMCQVLDFMKKHKKIMVSVPWDAGFTELYEEAVSCVATTLLFVRLFVRSFFFLHRLFGKWVSAG